MKQTLTINEIFYSIEGEGKRAGTPCVFVRTCGCNLMCYYCDTQYAQKLEQGTNLSIEEIVTQISQFNCDKVTLTGGEPLLQPNISLLIGALMQRGYEVNIETNGSLPLSPFRYDGKLFYTMDWKTAASGCTKFMHRENVLYIQKEDVLKFVVGSKEGLEEAKEIIQCLPVLPHIYISSIHGMHIETEIVDFIKQHNLPAKMQVQLHKIVWGAEARGV